MNWKSIKLESNSLCHFYAQKELKIMIQFGKCEIEGWEIPESNALTIAPERQGTLTTFQGCTLQVGYNLDCACFENFVHQILSFSNDLFLPNVYVNIHTSLEKKRCVNAARLLIIGDFASGTTKLAKTLVNYAIRSGHTPLYIDLDIIDNAISLPGTLGAIIPLQPCTIDNVWGRNDMKYILMHPNPEEIIFEKYETQINQMLCALNNKLRCDEITKSGIIVKISNFENMYSVNNCQRMRIYEAIISKLKINSVIIIDDTTLEASFPKTGIVPASLPKTSAKIENSSIDFSLKLGAYFLNGYRFPTRSKENRFKFCDPNTVIYYYDECDDQIKKLDSNKLFRDAILAVMHCNDSKKILETPIVGFYKVTHVSKCKKTFHAMSSCGFPSLCESMLLFTKLFGEILY